MILYIIKKIDKKHLKDTQYNILTTMPKKSNPTKAKIYFFLSNEYDVNIDDFTEYLNDLFTEKVKLYVCDDASSATNLVYNIYLKETIDSELAFNRIIKFIHSFVKTEFNCFYKKIKSTEKYDYKFITKTKNDNKPKKKEKYNFIDDDDEE